MKYSYVLQRNAFTGYLEYVSHPSASKIKHAKPVRMEFPWTTLQNVVDCGVFLMRHMETYKGTSVREWECGLSTEKNVKGDASNKQKRELDDLRHKYVAKILLSDVNTSRETIENEAKKYASLSDEYKKRLAKNALAKIHARLGPC